MGAEAPRLVGLSLILQGSSLQNFPQFTQEAN